MKHIIKHNANSSIFTLLIFITFFTDPLVSFHFIADYSAIIDYCIMAVLLLRVYSDIPVHKKRLQFAKIVLIVTFFIILKSFIIDGVSAVLGPDMGAYIKMFFALIYLYVCYTLFEERRLIFNFEVWANFLYYVCICTLITIILYKLGLYFLFYRREVLNYPCDQIPFIGLIHYDDNAKIRPSWLFAEPSYLGDVLGFNLMMMVRYYMQKSMKTKLLIYVLTILATGSMTGIGCTICSLLIVFILNKFHTLGKHYILTKIIALAFIPSLLTFASVYDTTDFADRSSTIGGSSVETRQVRIVYGIEQVARATTTQLILGRGKGFNDSEYGVSNCYLQLLCADGLLVLSVFLAIVFILLKQTQYEYFYMIIAMNMIDLSFLPFILLMLVIANQFYKYGFFLTKNNY